MPTLPSNLALTVIADGSLAVAADVRNDFSAIQTETNALLGILDDGVAGQFLKGVGTTVSFDYPPGYRYDYAQVTGDTSVTATTEGTANTVVTGGSVTYDGATAVFIEFFAPRAAIGTTFIKFWLYDAVGGGAAASIGALCRNDRDVPVTGKARITPSAAAHIYSVRATVDAGTGTVNAGAGGAGLFYPAYIRITKE